MRLIDADALYKNVVDSLRDNPHAYAPYRAAHNFEHQHFISMVDKSPTINAVLVVRCKDCVYNENGGCTHSEDYDLNYRPDYFCADGERRCDADLRAAD